jgi:hypothetical protein
MSSSTNDQGTTSRHSEPLSSAKFEIGVFPSRFGGLKRSAKMKKRIEIRAGSAERTSEGIELRWGDEFVAAIFVRNEILFATISGVLEPMTIRKASIQDSLDWLLVDFNEHDELHRAAIRFDGADWDQVDTLLKPLFRSGRITLNRHRVSENQNAEQAAAPNRSAAPVPESEVPVRGSEG